MQKEHQAEQIQSGRRSKNHRSIEDWLQNKHQRAINPLILIFSLFILHTSSFTAGAQQKYSIVAGVDTTGTQVIVKWFSEQVVFPQGVHVYRCEGGNDWVKLTTRPLKRGDFPVPQTVIQGDSTMQAFIDAAQAATNSDLKGIIGAMMMVKAVQDNHYARFMGLCYVDSDVVSGTAYRYKVTQVQAGRETAIAETGDILAGKYIPAAPPGGLTVKAGDTEAEVNWTPDPERFFGVNVYRKSNWDTQPVKANKDMILISEQQGTDGKLKYPDVFFTDKGLNNHYQYTYYLRCIDYLGYEGLPCDPVTVAPRDRTPPEPPRNMKIDVNGLSVNLTWEGPDVPSPDMAGYHIYRSKRMNSSYTQANMSLIGRDVYTFTDNLADPGEYFYYVAAVDSAGNEGGSFKDMADVQDVYPPAAPRGLTAKADSGRITLQWIAGDEKDLWGYQIFRTVQKDDPSYYVLVNSEPLTGTSFEDKLPAVSKNKFHYKVAAIDSAYNRSDFSDPVFGAMPDLVPPARPLIKKVTRQENALLVEWVPNVEADLKAYNVYRMNLNDSSTLHLNPRPVSRMVNRFTDVQVEPGVPYRYYITATDSSNNISDASEYFYATLVADEQPETDNPVSSFKASYKPGQKQVSLRWKLDNQPNLKGAIVFRNNGGAFIPVTGLLKSSNYNDRDIEDQDYTYRLHVFLNSGEVFKSEEIKVTIKAKE